jgi:tRNA-Thr(GGU) m(6)t(6)A37 methyltransferase TsaA
MTPPSTASEQITEEVTSWPGVTAGPGRRGEFAFRVGRREIGHLHGDRAAHFSFPKQVWAELFSQGRVGRHPVFPDREGPAARRIEDEADVRDVIELLRLNYDRVVARHGVPTRVEETEQPRFEIAPIGRVESALTDPAPAPKQGDEGAPDAWLTFEPAMVEALDGIQVGDEVVVLTWLDRARRDVLRVHPRGDESRPRQGVLSTRSPHRPNPIGLHRVSVTAIDGARVRVRNLEALDGTPIIDVKPVLSSDISER